jgi:serine/threonine-protein kinase
MKGGGSRRELRAGRVKRHDTPRVGTPAIARADGEAALGQAETRPREPSAVVLDEHGVARPATPTAPPPASPRAGVVVATRYRLVERLGKGGLGSVWRAHDEREAADVAVKLIARAREHTGDATARLMREGEAAFRLEHRSIVRVLDWGEADGEAAFLVMELVEGESLGALLNRDGALAPTEAVRVLLPVAEALETAHRAGVVHRDVKPENILLAREGGVVVPKLADFGIALQAGARRLTAAGALLGSPDYMSPEQAREPGEVDGRTDVWSLAVVLYEAVTLERPFRGHHFGGVIASILRNDPAPITDLGVGEAELWEIIALGLVKEREGRFQSALAMARALARWATVRGVAEDVTGAPLDRFFRTP